MSKEKTIKDDVRLIQNMGLSDKAARIYLAALELGESTVQTLAEKSGLKRTTVYYILDELLAAGAIFETKRNKKIYYLAELPRYLLKRAKERLSETEDAVEALDAREHSVFKKPRIYFLYGPSGFKQIWDKIFNSKTKEFRIITDGASFLDFVKEKYILDEIIKNKRALGVSSKQIIVDSPYARSIVAKDQKENRASRFLSSKITLPFTEVISEEFVAFISPRWDNTLFVVENERFAETRRHLFDATWDSLTSAR
jgi:sugar-specific transcriptional regulator TrmB